MMMQVEQSDLYVLPEMFSTGFATSPNDIAEEGDAPQSLTWMQRMANRLNAAVAGSVAVHCSDGSYRNRLYFVMPNDEVTYYDKRHLFTYGGEDKRYTRGEDRVIVNWRGVRFLLQVCYDLRFPVFARNTGDYDCAIYVANWPDSRRRVWDVLLQARAMENQCYVIGVNRMGKDVACNYDGGSVVIDAYGKTVASCSDNTAEAVSIDLDMERLATFRKKFPVLQDADYPLYGIAQNTKNN